MNQAIEIPLAIYKPTKKQKAFIEAYFTPDSDTFGNAYQSAVAVGYSPLAARTITGNARNLQWVQDAMQLYAAQLQPEHIYVRLQALAMNAKRDRDQIRALELMAKIRGMFIERSESNVNVSFNNAVPRPITPTEVIDTQQS